MTCTQHKQRSHDSHMTYYPSDANIGIGVSIFSETESDFGDLTIFWVYLAFVVAAIILNSALLLYFTCEAATKGEEGQLFPLHPPLPYYIHDMYAIHLCIFCVKGVFMDSVPPEAAHFFIALLFFLPTLTPWPTCVHRD